MPNTKLHVVIFTGGIVRKGKAVDEALKNADKIIAADSGANAALAFGKTPDVIVGDFDSIKEKIIKSFDFAQDKKKVEIIRFPKEKNETDTELAIAEALRLSASWRIAQGKKEKLEISIIGGIEGDRIDHILANIFLLTQYNIPISFVNGNQRVWLSTGPAEETIHGTPSDLLSLIPIAGDITGVTLEGLQYKPTNKTLLFGQSRGTSNVLTEKNAEVKFRKGILLFVHTRQ